MEINGKHYSVFCRVDKSPRYKIWNNVFMSSAAEHHVNLVYPLMQLMRNTMHMISICVDPVSQFQWENVQI